LMPRAFEETFSKLKSQYGSRSSLFMIMSDDRRNISGYLSRLAGRFEQTGPYRGGNDCQTAECERITPSAPGTTGLRWLR
jgi:hypothetical protein